VPTYGLGAGSGGIVGSNDAYDVEVSANFLSQHINLLFIAIIPQFRVSDMHQPPRISDTSDLDVLGRDSEV
jgi:hypothetical protein